HTFDHCNWTQRGGHESVWLLVWSHACLSWLWRPGRTVSLRSTIWSQYYISRVVQTAHWLDFRRKPSRLAEALPSRTTCGHDHCCGVGISKRWRKFEHL